MMKNQLISVIVPVYNVEKYLRQCIDSILSQTYTNFELILVDDGSKDQSGEICNEYAEKDSRIRLFHKENGGVSSARNLGLDNAHGEYICFVDSDDWVDNTYIEDMLKPGDYDLVMQGMKQATKIWKYSLKSLNDTIQILDVLISSGRNHDLLFNGPYCKLYKNNIIRDKNLRFNEKIWLGEDFLFNVCYISFSSTAKITDTCSYNYRTTSDSLTHRFLSIEDLLIRANTFRETAKIISQYTNYPKLYYAIVSKIIEGLFRKCYRVHRKKNDRYLAYSFFRQNVKSKMFEYMTFPYSKFRIFKYLPFTLSDSMLILIFKIMNKIKTAPNY